ncbi:hypothetical protein BSK59_15420 [Paenibacillus odorifer]|uniref:copper amine oxidase N-terminal domain-containing protein n=1 Tax=Paenibacillus odorifer TaxID=189426 RepID=UPI00096CE040|nr:copper amine oxidase N-terminal domain-containing protein [Paenibacillus odorifer]OME53969.1 hypothetical protein BSK59_15420 [Paenibacillus odorifer]
MKKVLSLFLILMISFVSLGQADMVSAASDTLPIVIAGMDVDTSTEIVPIYKDGRNYVPFKAVFSALYLDVKYNGTTKEVSGERDGFSIKFIVGEKAATINGVKQSVDASAFIQNGVTYIPINYISQKGTGLTLKKSYDGLYVEGKVFGKKNLYENGNYYLGEGIIKGRIFNQDGTGKNYNKNGQVYYEPITKDGITGIFVNGKGHGWFKYTYPENFNGYENYRISYYENGKVSGIEEFYDDTNDLWYIKDWNKDGDITTVKKQNFDN